MQSIVHNNLISPNVEERIDAARHLGALRVGDTMVLYALRERLKHDDEKRVVYESAKALATIGECSCTLTLATSNMYMTELH